MLDLHGKRAHTRYSLPGMFMLAGEKLKLIFRHDFRGFHICFSTVLISRSTMEATTWRRFAATVCAGSVLAPAALRMRFPEEATVKMRTTGSKKIRICFIETLLACVRTWPRSLPSWLELLVSQRDHRVNNAWLAAPECNMRIGATATRRPQLPQRSEDLSASRRKAVLPLSAKR